MTESERTTKFVPKLIDPTPEQIAIQIATDRTIVVKANAGAAKTTTLALRVAESWRRGLPPEQVLALTFSDPACQALRQALRKIGVPQGTINLFRINTFEDFCRQVLDEILGISVPEILSNEKLAQYFWQAAKRVEENESERWRSHIIMPSFGDNRAVEEFLNMSILLKGTMRDLRERGENRISPDYAETIGIEYTQLRIFLAYERIRRRENSDTPLFRGPWDATYDLAQLLHEGTSINGLKSWPFFARTFVVDEMHDLNHAMFKVLAEILNTTQCFFCGVGDTDQVLHEATGADSIYMDQEINANTRRKTRTYPLTASYRFGKSLAEYAGDIADKPYSSRTDHNTDVATLMYDTPDACANLVVDAASEWIDRNRRKPFELAILLRHSHQSVLIENALLAKGLAYTTVGIDSYLMRPEVLFVRGLLAVALDDFQSVQVEKTRLEMLRTLLFFAQSKIVVEGREHDTQEDLLQDALIAVKNAPSFLVSFFSNQVIKNTDETTRKRLSRSIEIAKKNTSSDVLNDMLNELDIVQMSKKLYISQERRNEVAGNLSGLRKAASKHKNPRDFFRSLNDAEQKQIETKGKQALILADIPSVKGLEFDSVLIPGLERSEFPSSISTPREEKNMFYVAITRAREQLRLFGAASNPSEYLRQ